MVLISKTLRFLQCPEYIKPWLIFHNWWISIKFLPVPCYFTFPQFETNVSTPHPASLNLENLHLLLHLHWDTGRREDIVTNDTEKLRLNVQLLNGEDGRSGPVREIWLIHSSFSQQLQAGVQTPNKYHKLTRFINCCWWLLSIHTEYNLHRMVRIKMLPTNYRHRRVLLDQIKQQALKQLTGTLTLFHPFQFHKIYQWKTTDCLKKWKKKKLNPLPYSGSQLF